MTQFLRMKHASVAIDGAEACLSLAELVVAAEAINAPERIDLELRYEANGIHLRWHKLETKSLEFHLDYLKTVGQLRSYPAPKQGAFNQALGKKTRHVVDATGGWGMDALLMCMQGYHVTVFERQPMMAALMSEAFDRLKLSTWAIDNEVTVPRVVLCDAVTELRERHYPADCVYLDPMFPPKKKKSAAVNKQMQLLQWLVGDDLDASALARSAIDSGYARVAVKRPDHALPLIDKPSTQFSSKLVHYDVYLNNG